MKGNKKMIKIIANNLELLCHKVGTFTNTIDLERKLFMII